MERRTKSDEVKKTDEVVFELEFDFLIKTFHFQLNNFIFLIC